MTFLNDIRKFNKKAERTALMAFKQVALAASDKVTERTPVDTGKAKGSWMGGINSPARNSPGYLAVIGRLKLGDTFFLTNNQPYIRRLEYGWSMQAPAGMVRITVAEFQNIVKRIAIGVRR